MFGCRVLDHPCVMASDRLDRGKILFRHLMELPDRRDPMLVKQLLAVDTDMFQPGEIVLLHSRRLTAEVAKRPSDCAGPPHPPAQFQTPGPTGATAFDASPPPRPARGREGAVMEPRGRRGARRLKLGRRMWGAGTI